MGRTIGLLLLVMILSGALLAGWNVWTQSLPASVTVCPVSFDASNPDLMYATTLHGSTTFRTTDGGQNWSSINGGTGGRSLWALAADPQVPSTVYAGTDDGNLLESTDAGEHWLVCSFGLPVPIDGGNRSIIHEILIDPQSSSTRYVIFEDVKSAANSRRALYRTVDGGRHWYLSLDWEVSCLAIHPSSPNILLASSEPRQLVRSTDGGQTWEDSNAGLSPTSADVQDICFNPSNPDLVYVATRGYGLFKSCDGGRNWSQMAFPYGSFRGVFVDPTNSRRIYALSNSFVSLSVDGGLNWSPLNTGAQVYSFTIDPRTPRVLYAGIIDGGLMRSDDGGQTWRHIDSGLSEPSIAQLGMVAESPNLLYASGYCKFFKSTDGGLHWQLMANSLPFSYRYDYSLDIDPFEPDRVFLALGSAGLFRSSDGGVHWSAVGGPFEGQTVSSVVHDPRVPGRLFAATSQLFRSEDGGTTWQSTGYTAFAMIDRIVVDSTRDGWIFIVSRGELLRSTDGGISFTYVRSGDKFGFTPANPDAVYWMGPLGLYRSLDGGSTATLVWWSQFYHDYEVEHVAVSPFDSREVNLACGRMGLLRTLNGGETWFHADRGLHPLRANWLWTSPSDPSILHVSEGPSGIFSISFAEAFDVDLNGVVSAADSVFVAQYIVGNAPLPPDTFFNGDFDQDGAVTIGDLLCLQYALVGP